MACLLFFLLPLLQPSCDAVTATPHSLAGTLSATPLLILAIPSMVTTSSMVLHYLLSQLPLISPHRLASCPLSWFFPTTGVTLLFRRHIYCFFGSLLVLSGGLLKGFLMLSCRYFLCLGLFFPFSSLGFMAACLGFRMVRGTEVSFLGVGYAVGPIPQGLGGTSFSHD